MENQIIFTKEDLIKLFEKKCLSENFIKNAFTNEDAVKNYNNIGFTVKLLNDNSPASVLLLYKNNGCNCIRLLFNKSNYDKRNKEPYEKVNANMSVKNGSTMFTFELDSFEYDTLYCNFTNALKNTL